MEKRIIVAGAGHGGIVAAYYLADKGYDVTVYEKNKRKNLGHDQDDAIHLDGFEKSGIPIPEKWYVKRTPIAFCVPGTDLEPLLQADNGETYNIEIDRNALYEHLIEIAENAGVRFVYGCEILSPIVLGSRVAGIKTTLGDFYADLIIDACGVYSPVRTKLPDYLHIQKNLGKYDVLNTYRVYFNKLPDVPEPELKYMVSLIPGEFCGLSWLVTHEDSADILIGSFKEFEKEAAEKYIDIYRSDNPYLGDDIIRGGKDIAHIPIRQPLSLMVADGYAAVGDSAFMTVPVKGSGIGYAMRAGKMLADCIFNDTDGLYTRKTLWNYQVNYFKEIGSQSCILAVARNEFPNIKRSDIEFAFSEKIVSSEDMALFGNEAGLFKVLTSLKISELTGKAKKVLSNQDIRKLIITIARNVTRCMVIDRSFPEKYDSEAVIKWANAYDSFFESIKVSEEEK